MALLTIKNGRVLDPVNKIDKILDIIIENGKVVLLGRFEKVEGDVLDASGLWVMPGFIDLHVHFREPGQTHKEDIASGLAAAARGGFTTVCTMPNTTPALDSAELIRQQIGRAKEVGLGCILPVGAITVGLSGTTLATHAEMVAAGAVGISDDGLTVQDVDVQRRGMKSAAAIGVPLFAHCEEEDEIVERDIKLAESTGAHLHVCHVSTARAVELVRAAKQRGVRITAEAAPHHFTLSQEDFDGTDTNFKMNPPLRDKKDVEAVRQGLADGTIDAIATDHAPHHADEKAQPYALAPNGVVGLETALPLALSELVETGLLTPLQFANVLSSAPAAILGINKGNLAVGRPADIAIVDPTAAYTINPADFASKGKNTPFGGRAVKGKVIHTIFDGKLVVKNSNIH